MFIIKMLRYNTTIAFAAEKLTKYLRQMMSDGSKIQIESDGNAKDGFRLGLTDD